MTNANLLAIGTDVFVNRGDSIVQRGRIFGHTVTTTEIVEKVAKGSKEEKTSLRVYIQYAIRFPYQGNSSHSDFDDNSSPFPPTATVEENAVYLTAQEAFEQKRATQETQETQETKQENNFMFSYALSHRIRDDLNHAKDNEDGDDVTIRVLQPLLTTITQMEVKHDERVKEIIRDEINHYDRLISEAGERRDSATLDRLEPEREVLKPYLRENKSAKGKRA